MIDTSSESKRIKVDFASLQDLFCVYLASFGIVQRCDSMRQHSEPGSMPAAFAEVPSSTWLDPIRIDIIDMCISTEHIRLGRTQTVKVLLICCEFADMLRYAKIC